MANLDHVTKGDLLTFYPDNTKEKIEIVHAWYKPNAEINNWESPQVMSFETSAFTALFIRRERRAREEYWLCIAADDRVEVARESRKDKMIWISEHDVNLGHCFDIESRAE